MMGIKTLNLEGVINILKEYKEEFKKDTELRE